MTINDIAWMMRNSDRFQRQGTQPNLPNGSLPPAGHVNPYCEPGMDITGMTREDFQTVPVPKEAEQKMKDLAMRGMDTYYGMSGPDGDIVADTIEAYSLEAAVPDRINTSYTLTNIYRAEVNRIFDFIRSRAPGWEPGQKFDTSILNEYRQGVDVKA